VNVRTPRWGEANKSEGTLLSVQKWLSVTPNMLWNMFDVTNWHGDQAAITLR
jgi:hypothetical protein